MSRLVLAQPFVKRLSQLPNQDQKMIRDAVMQLHLDTADGGMPRPGLRWHALQSPKLYSLSPNMDYRVIVYHSGQDYAVLYADHHDAAYDWAARRRLEVHPYTGAMQVVQIEERTEVITRIQEVTEERPFSTFGAAYLLQLGVPEHYLQAVHHASARNAHELLEVLPEEVSERLIALLSGELVVPPDKGQDPFTHPDARRLFAVAQGEDELEAALNGSWQDWIVFLHPSQRRLIERRFNGPARVTGGAGTGKTVVALHRAARLAREGQRVLLTSYSRTLVSRLETMLDMLGLGEARANITVMTVHALAMQVGAELGLPDRQPDDLPERLKSRLEGCAQAQGSALSPEFLFAEWRGVIEAQGLRTWEEYREARRTGRGSPLGARARGEVWRIMECLRRDLAAERKFTWRTMCDAVTDRLVGQSARFDAVIADEGQDLGPAELRFLLALLGGESGRLLLTLDEGQRIYQRAFPLKSLGLNFQGRSARLKLNYRTSQQIRELADRLLPGMLRDADEEVEGRLSLSRFQGPPAELLAAPDRESELRALGDWVSRRLADGLQPAEIAVFTRHDPQATARELTDLTGHQAAVVGVSDEGPDLSKISVSTMHRAKGLEYRAVAVTGLTAQSLPSAQRLAEFTDPGDQEDFVTQERHLLYVAATRARDWLLLTYCGAPSRFLAGLPVTQLAATE